MILPIKGIYGVFSSMQPEWLVKNKSQVLFIILLCVFPTKI